MQKKVAIQGIKGSFHHIVSQHYFGENVQVEECLTFDKVVDSILQGKTEVGIMALENSIAGSILPNYALIDDNNLVITGEHYLDIQHHLMALPGQSLEDIREVCSHPMALLQCKRFFKKHPHIKLVEDKDTAEVARRIQESKSLGVGAIASRLAAELYGLEIVAKSIQTIKNNETRFVIIQPEKGESLHQNSINKASLKFELNHQTGSLAAILNAMSDCQLNLTKIQSLPKIEVPWKYAFFVDVTFGNYDDFEKAKPIMRKLAENVKIFGEYKSAKF